jgi:hypothetical protein
MVSCQWRLTTGRRAGQACGKGKAVFCGLHEPKARDAISRIPIRNIVSDYLSGHFSWDLSRAFYWKPQRTDYSASWIWDEDKNQLSSRMDGSILQRMEFITDPQRVSSWLEEQISKGTTDVFDQISPESITAGQQLGISNLRYLFNKRIGLSKNWKPSYFRNGGSFSIPLPFFQDSFYRMRNNYSDLKQQVFNRGFIHLLKKNINLTPDYPALWNWFFLKFDRKVQRELDSYHEGYNMEAITNDLAKLIRAYQADLDTRPDPNQPAPNRYRYRN